MKNNKKGFTLIELIAVLVILAILALIVTPIVLNIVKQAKDSANKRNIDAYGRSIELAVATYLLDNGVFPNSIDQLTIEYSGSKVECGISVLNADSSVYLSECKVGNSVVKDSGTEDGFYHYGIFKVNTGGDTTDNNETDNNGTDNNETDNNTDDNNKNLIYFTPSTNWRQENARFALYFFNNDSNEWVSMTATGDGKYVAEMKDGYSKLIFVRMNPSTTENNWNNKWNQTADIDIPSDMNYYTITSTDWDNATGDWSKI